jgi:hypothetical protein
MANKEELLPDYEYVIEDENEEEKNQVGGGNKYATKSLMLSLE